MKWILFLWHTLQGLRNEGHKVAINQNPIEPHGQFLQRQTPTMAQPCSCECCNTTDRPTGESGVMCAPSFNTFTKGGIRCGDDQCANIGDTILTAHSGNVAYARFCLVRCCPTRNEFGTACMKLPNKMVDDAETTGGNGNDVRCQPLSERVGDLPPVQKKKNKDDDGKKGLCKYGPCVLDKKDKPPAVLERRVKNLENAISNANG